MSEIDDLDGMVPEKFVGLRKGRQHRRRQLNPTCRKCGAARVMKKTPKGFQLHCKECQKRYRAAWLVRNPNYVSPCMAAARPSERKTMFYEFLSPLLTKAQIDKAWQIASNRRSPLQREPDR